MSTARRRAIRWVIGGWLASLGGLAAGCSDGRDDSGEEGSRNGVSLVVVAEPTRWVSSLTLRVDVATWEGEGPSGSERIATEVDRAISLIGGGDHGGGLGWELEVGAWREVAVAVRLVTRGETPAVSASGVWVDDDDDAVPFVLAAGPELVLGGTGAVELGPGVDPVVEVRLDPDAWFTGIDLENLQDDDEEVLVLDRATHPEAAATIAAQIVSTTRVLFPGDSP